MLLVSDTSLIAYMQNLDIFLRIIIISLYGPWLEVESIVWRILCDQQAALSQEAVRGIKPVLQSSFLTKILYLQLMEMRLLIVVITV